MAEMPLFTAVTNMLKTSSRKLSLSQVFDDFPALKFKESEEFYFSAKDNCIYYNKKHAQTELGTFQLLHEIGHALSGHHHYESGIQLIKMESEAWSKAKNIAKQYDLEIPAELVEHCLDSYRDWLHLRSLCPNCKSVSVETDSASYHCFNCLQKWTVPTDQRSRCYRLKTENGS